MWTRFLNGVNKSTEWLTAGILATMVVLIFIQIISRVILSSSFAWTDEVARYLMIWLTFLAASVGFKHGAHIGVEVFVRNLPKTLKIILQIIAALASFVFFVIMISMGWEIISVSMKQTSPALNIPMGYVYIIFPISGMLIILNLIDATIKSVLNN